jgi:hypothetical protein
MHGGAIELNSTMHGGGVQVPRGMQWVVNADVAGKRGKVYPATHHGGVRLTRHMWWRGTAPARRQRVAELAVLHFLHLQDVGVAHEKATSGLFSWWKSLGSATVALFVLFGNLCPVMD